MAEYAKSRASRGGVERRSWRNASIRRIFWDKYIGFLPTCKDTAIETACSLHLAVYRQIFDRASDGVLLYTDHHQPSSVAAYWDTGHHCAKSSCFTVDRQMIVEQIIVEASIWHVLKKTNASPGLQRSLWLQAATHRYRHLIKRIRCHSDTSNRDFEFCTVILQFYRGRRLQFCPH